MSWLWARWFKLPHILCCLKIDEDSQNRSLLLNFLYYHVYFLKMFITDNLLWSPANLCWIFQMWLFLKLWRPNKTEYLMNYWFKGLICIVIFNSFHDRGIICVFECVCACAHVCVIKDLSLNISSVTHHALPKTTNELRVNFKMAVESLVDKLKKLSFIARLLLTRCCENGLPLKYVSLQFSI